MDNKRYPAEQWAEWVEVACPFGLSVAEVFDAIGVSASSFCCWRTKLSQVPTDGPAAFVPVTLMPSAAVEVALPCGTVAHVPRDEDQMRQVPGILLQRAVDSINLIDTSNTLLNLQIGLSDGHAG
jgi:transposase-like protein